MHEIGRAAAEWVEAHALSGPVVVLGHSTGAQGALDAALRLQDTQPGLGLVMAGPTFTPRQRRFPRMAAAAATAYLRDSPGALVVVPTGLRRLSGVLSVVRSGMRDSPEERLRKLRVPLALTAGEADTFAPKEWLAAARLGGRESPSVTVRTLSGSHNNPYTHAGAGGRGRRRGGHPCRERRLEPSDPASLSERGPRPRTRVCVSSGAQVWPKTPPARWSQRQPNQE